MALDNSFTINVSNIAAYSGPRDAADPAQNLDTFDFDSPPATLGTGAENTMTLIGHTSEETAVSLTPEIEGNERLGSLQSPSLRRTPVRTAWALLIAALQGDNNVLQMVFGGGDITEEDSFGIPKGFAVQRRALYLVMADAEKPLDMYFGLADVVPEGEISFDPSALTEFSLSAGILDSDNQTLLGRIGRQGLGTPA